MKPKLYCVLLICAVFASCVTFKQFDDRAQTAKESNYEASIIKTNGEIISGKTLKHKNYDPYDGNLVRVTNNKKAFTIDGKNYNDSDVVAFQDKKAFHKRFKNLFLIRLVKGKINLYYFDNTGYDKTYTYYSNAPTTTTSVNKRKTQFFFEKQGEDIIPIGISDLKNAMRDNKKALKKLNSYYPKDSYSRQLDIEKLVAAIEMYNQ